MKHPDGTPTRFEVMIAAALGENIGAADCPYLKHHTMREWKEHTGRQWKAGDKIHFATGVRTKKYHCFREGICTHVTYVRIGIEDGRIFVELKDRKKRLDPIEFARNDGLDWGQFLQWFEDEVKKHGEKIMQVVHWTDLRYD